MKIRQDEIEITCEEMNYLAYQTEPAFRDWVMEHMREITGKTVWLQIPKQPLHDSKEESK